MADLLPDVPRFVDQPTRIPARVDREVRRAEMDVFRWELAAAVVERKELADAALVEAVITGSLDSELRVLEEYAGRASGSMAAQVIVARRLEQMSAVNSRRIARRLR